MFILSATTHSAALLAALSTETRPRSEQQGAESTVFRAVCPLKVNITLRKFPARLSVQL